MSTLKLLPVNLKVLCMLVTWLVSHFEMSWLKLVAELKVFVMSLTLLVSGSARAVARVSVSRVHRTAFQVKVDICTRTRAV